MTEPTSAGRPAAVTINDPRPHAELVDWLNSKQVDKAIAGMSAGAHAKKPGRVLERISKKASGWIRGLKVISWAKDQKFVYGLTFTEAALSAAVHPVDDSAVAPLLERHAIFQTDFYFRTKGDYTELDAVTVAALTDEVRTSLAAAGIGQTSALTAARVFSTGLDDAGIAPGQTTRFLVPVGDGAIECVNLPIDRIEHEEKKLGQVLVAIAWHEVPDATRIAGLAHAMTKEGHPGKDAFAELVKASARPFSA